MRRILRRPRLVAAACGTALLAVAAAIASQPASAATQQATTFGTAVLTPAGLQDPSIPALPEPKCSPRETPVHATAAGKKRMVVLSTSSSSLGRLTYYRCLRRRSTLIRPATRN